MEILDLFCREMRTRKTQITTLTRLASSFIHHRSSHLSAFSPVSVEDFSGSQPATVQNLVQGNWEGSSRWNSIVNPLNGEPFIKIAEVPESAVKPFVKSLSECPKYGLHNPFRSPERYLLLGDVSAKAANMLARPEISNFFTRLIQRVSPKSYNQALGEVVVTQKFLENFSGDQEVMMQIDT